jgi:COP9 signalosome complex subunit 3
MEGRLQQVVSAIEEMSSRGEFGKLLTHLQAQEEVLIQAMPQLDDLLPVLNPASHTLGMVYILHCKAAAVPLSNLQAVNTFLSQCRTVLLGGDPEQIRIIPKEFVAVGNKFSAAAIAIKSPLVAVRPLLAAAAALQPGPTHFTPLHAEFLKVCILSKTYSAALPMLQQPLLQVDKSATLVAPRDLLLYHYYGGIIHIGFKQFKQAMESFVLCCSSPCTVLHAIMIEAYKKCVFCSLIATGELPKLPKYTAAVLQRHLKTGVAPYTEYATAFASKKGAALRACLEKHQAAFARDRNLGLAKQAVERLAFRNIHTLTQTYLTLSLEHIAESAELANAADAEAHICRMVADRQICANIDQVEGMVHFYERPEKFDSDGAVKTLEACLGRAVAVAHKLDGMSQDLGTDAVYLSRALSQERQPRWDEDEDPMITNK